MTRFATEQPDVAMDSSLAVQSEVYATMLGTLPLVADMKWEIHVEFTNGMWWAMPHELSDPIVHAWTHGAQLVSYVWDWGNTRTGSYRANGAYNTFNRYTIDFDTMLQRNVDNDRTRKVKVVCVLR